MYRDILESRISKIVRLASAEAVVKPSTLQPEESVLYSELHSIISSWREEMRKLEAR
jgi:DNA replication initiation complex subunit (GINS family)